MEEAKLPEQDPSTTKPNTEVRKEKQESGNETVGEGATEDG
jgi:hypothetical protein